MNSLKYPTVGQGKAETLALILAQRPGGLAFRAESLPLGEKVPPLPLSSLNKNGKITAKIQSLDPGSEIQDPGSSILGPTDTATDVLRKARAWHVLLCVAKINSRRIKSPDNHLKAASRGQWNPLS